MGMTKKSKGKSKGKLGKVVSKAKGLLKGSSGKRKSRVTPEKLAKKILVEKLKKKLYKMKYGGR